ncbi:hypothetical protein [Paenibacillus kribbensis]|uniref:hypothetical protein n=1 Tax=Paenibacillus kribbensis TaxID=172713 RepID=UPI00114CBA8C|nr:hypothetical protein [Paenibacillus kribbensis]
MKCPAAAGDAANARRCWLCRTACELGTVMSSSQASMAILSPACMPGEKLTAIERSYRRTALPSPPMGWGKFFLAAAGRSGG